MNIRLLILLPLIFFNTTLFAQRDININGFISEQETQKKEIRFCNGHAYSQLTGIPCYPDKFWGVNFDSIYQYTLSGSTVSLDSALLPAFNQNMAFCNNMWGTPFSPTFVTGNSYFDGIQWSTVSGLSCLNCGGNGNFLYSMGSCLSLCSSIYFYNGTSYNLVFSQSGIKINGVADIAIDDNGFAYVFSAIDTFSAGVITDSLFVINSIGQIIKQLPVVLNTSCAYGAFLLNSIIYIGLGFCHPTHPHHLMPISIVNDSVIFGTPIPMPLPLAAQLGDFGSCNAGYPLGIMENDYLKPDFGINPNPNNGVFSVSYHVPSGKKSLLEIFDLKGFLIYKKQLYSRKEIVEIRLPEISSGVYLSVFTSGNDRMIKKLLVAD